MLSTYLTNTNMNKTQQFNEIASIFEDIFNPISTLGSYDIIENNNAYTIEIAVPGFKKDQITIDISNNSLSVSGESKRSQSDYTKQGIYYGKFARRFTLPDNASGNINAKLEDGILKITIPKSEQTKSKIKID
jgi:HSP20 family protein